MAKFGKKEKPQPGISTASLPDIVFMLLFFFMVSTVMRQADLLVNVSLPQATQLEKLANKSLVSYIYLGPPSDPALGSEPKIQVNDVFVTEGDIIQFIAEEKANQDEALKDKIVVSLRADREVKMGIITDIKLKLREADARRLNYASVKRAEK